MQNILIKKASFTLEKQWKWLHDVIWRTFKKYTDKLGTDSTSALRSWEKHNQNKTLTVFLWTFEIGQTFDKITILYTTIVHL